MYRIPCQAPGLQPEQTDNTLALVELAQWERSLRKVSQQKKSPTDIHIGRMPKPSKESFLEKVTITET